jgi:hypothetical protein
MGRVDAHRATRIAGWIERYTYLRANFLERAVLLVMQQKVLHRIISHDQVHPAVAIEVAGCETK